MRMTEGEKSFCISGDSIYERIRELTPRVVAGDTFTEGEQRFVRIFRFQFMAKPEVASRVEAVRTKWLRRKQDEAMSEGEWNTVAMFPEWFILEP